MNDVNTHLNFHHGSSQNFVNQLTIHSIFAICIQTISVRLAFLAYFFLLKHESERLGDGQKNYVVILIL